MVTNSPAHVHTVVVRLAKKDYILYPNLIFILNGNTLQVQLLHSERVMGTFCLEFAYSPNVGVGFLQVFQFPPSVPNMHYRLCNRLVTLNRPHRV